MKELFAFIEKHSFILLFFVLQIISFILIVNFNEPQKSQYGAVSTAFQGKLHSVTHKITQYFYLEFANRRLVEENAKLYENQEFSQYDNAVNSSVVEDTEYEQQYEYIPAKVLNNSINKIQNFIVINKGWKQGIQKNMAVICPTGIVGVVVRTSQHYSLIMTVLNTNFKVSTRFKNSGFYGSLSWSGQNYKLATLEEIPLHAVIKNGDTLVTNSYSNLFPSGIMVGTVESFYQNDNFFSADVLLSTDFKRLDYVYVVKDLFKKERQNLEGAE
ncbi:MAG: rod shape-determining protein MreC [Bacteroidales bacterium]|jgi:rod shape-determining protein MreC|nr:rod shape-determining protein MreC [Bacteroidales bacterium]MBR3981104.1 rod shape-determining protein MreC [Bacteroidales bacterium]MBR4349371.1 rod shape-determining protein MreC [Bacteroidales bacterium]MCR4800225.1 rod shape-determining protein MreC [Bacteroidales bacterium]